MKIVVCIRLGRDGEPGAFDAAAYEEALRIEGAEVILLSMGPEGDAQSLLKLTRLGASRVILLSDKAFAGADTLATAYTLSGAIKRIRPDLVFTGRQTLIGDTAQTGPMTAAMLGFSLITNVMNLRVEKGRVIAETREDGTVSSGTPALLTFERTAQLRLPRLRSKLGELEVWRLSDIGADESRTGLLGSPTRVVKTFENESGRRRCKFIGRDELGAVIEAARNKKKSDDESAKTLRKLDTGAVISVTEAPLSFADSICDGARVVPLSGADALIAEIKESKPRAVIFGSDAASKRLSAEVAAKLSLGLCADCTALEYDGEDIYMYRPALSGTVIAKIKSTTVPMLATVRTKSESTSDITVAMGYGVKDSIERVKAFAHGLGASLATTRKMTDNALSPYELQVGLTGRCIAPPIYIAIGVSGAVHHVVGMERSGTVIAINPDKNAPIFDYADYGILEEF